MGDARFDRAWADWKRRLAGGSPKDGVLRDADEGFLVETLASTAAGADAFERNVIATELLNRSARRDAVSRERSIDEISREARETIERSAERVRSSRARARASRDLLDDEDDEPGRA